MFIKEYLSDLDYELLLSNYDYNYLELIDETRFKIIFNLLIEYNLYFTRDIILRYIEIFTFPKNIIENNIINLKNKLGKNYVEIIGDDLRYLKELIPKDKKVN